MGAARGSPEHERSAGPRVKGDEPLNRVHLRTQAFADRASKVRVSQLAGTVPVLTGFLEALPRQFAGDDLRNLVQAIAAAHRTASPVAVTMGAHVIKCGLSPVLIDLMRRGIVTSVATNGAAIIHDSELALFGHTSEDVERGLRTGTFGMAEETHRFVNGALNEGVRRGDGIGTAIGQALLQAGAPHAEISLFAAAASLGVPTTVHVAIGTDIIHMHETADGAAIGEGSLRDFHRLVEVIRNLGSRPSLSHADPGPLPSRSPSHPGTLPSRSHADPGVLINLGSAVILPEVVLKALAILANQEVRLDGCLFADIDMARGYRGSKQIVERIAALGGHGIGLVGHHEIMIPLLAALVLTELC